MMSLTSPDPEPRVIVTETVPITRQTVQGVLEALRVAFQGEDRPTRIVYARGEDLLVERKVLASKVDRESFLTPYQMVRQHSELEIMEPMSSSLETACMAAQTLSDRKARLIYILAKNRGTVMDWIDPRFSIEEILRTAILEDPECPAKCVFFCGAVTGDLVRDIEYAVLCRL